MRLFRLLSELKRRRVYRVAAAWLVASFAVLEAADLVLPVLPAPGWTYQALVILVLAGLPVAVVLSWIFDITPEGIRREASLGDDAEPAPETGIKGRPLVVVTVLVGAVGVGAWIAGRSSVAAPDLSASSTLAVLPFSPAVPDSALSRLGRELAITLSSSITGTAGIPTAEPLAVLANASATDGPLPLEEAREIAGSLGAATFLQGAILGSEGNFRLEFSLYQTDDLQRLGSQSVGANRADALTDSATLAVLRMMWREVPAGPPNPGAISTTSLKALQAYLSGEQAIADGRLREAPTYFARAVALDSTFWFAYWRLQFALEYHGSPVDSLVAARVWEHRAELPDRDRMLIEARASSGSARLEILRDATRQFPSYWPAWWDLADFLVHRGGYFGSTLPETRGVLERTLELNPGLVSAWSHLFWTETKSRNVDAMNRIVNELADARYDRVSLQEAGINSLAYYQALLALARTGGDPLPAVTETGVQELSSYRGPNDPAQVAGGLMDMGFLRAQVRLSMAILERDAAPAPMRRAQNHILAHAWAGLGRWDSALVAARAFASSATDPVDLLLPYQISGVGAWAGFVDPEVAAVQRPSPAGPWVDRGELVAEAAWLDGLVAFASADRRGLARARDRLAGSGGRVQEPLRRSLDAFQEALAGDSAAAGEQLAALEAELAEDGIPYAVAVFHPFLNGVNRLAAARWLMGTGDTLTARSLLPWYEAVFSAAGYRLERANQVLAAPALRLRLDLARTAGRAQEAADLAALLRGRLGENGP